MKKIEFDGQQDNERVLYKLEKHRLFHILDLIKIVLAGLLLVVVFWIIAGITEQYIHVIRLLGLVLGVCVFGIGWWGLSVTEKKGGAFVTDRRLIRLTATTPWTINTRSLSWDEVVKVKTQNQGFFWRLLNVGSVIVHARSTIVPINNQEKEQLITNDDIRIDGVAYYQDLGNYMEKVLYLFKKEPESLRELRAFVAKPRGKRY